MEKLRDAKFVMENWLVLTYSDEAKVSMFSGHWKVQRWAWLCLETKKVFYLEWKKLAPEKARKYLKLQEMPKDERFSVKLSVWMTLDY